MSTQEELVESLGNLNVMQLIALTKELEQKWGVSAAPVVSQQSKSSEPTPVVDEQTEFTVELTSVPPAAKMAAIKAVRDAIGLGLKESKDLVEGAPKTIKDGLTKADAEDMKAKFEAVGAVITLK